MGYVRLRCARATPPARAPAVSPAAVRACQPSNPSSAERASALCCASVCSSAVSAATQASGVNGSRRIEMPPDLTPAKALDALAGDVQLVGAAAEVDRHAAHALLVPAQQTSAVALYTRRVRAATTRAWQPAPRPRRADRCRRHAARPRRDRRSPRCSPNAGYSEPGTCANPVCAGCSTACPASTAGVPTVA